MKKYKPRYKQWIEYDGKPIIGEGRAKLLAEIRNTASIQKAAERLSLPYRTAWALLKKIGDAIGSSAVKTYRGGAKGGGGAILTEDGEKILREYEKYKKYLRGITQDEEYWETIFMKISARNRIKGMIKRIKKGEVASTVKIEISKPTTITAMITKEAVEELGLREGDEVEAVIKATEVMISK